MAASQWKDYAELVGIASIVASLIFVGMQMRQEKEIAQAQAIHEFSSTGVDYRVAIAEVSDVLVKGNDGEELDAVEQHKLRLMIEAAEDRVFFQSAATATLGMRFHTSEQKFAAFLYANPAARAAWLQIAEDMKRYVDPLRSPESLARTKEGGSKAFRDRIRTHLAKLDELYGE